MAKKEYKVGDRIFYEVYPSREIETAIIKRIENKTYTDDRGKEIPYKWLIVWESGNCASGIEDYNCLPYSNPRAKEEIRKYRKFDKEKDSIIEAILKILSPYSKFIQEEALDLLKIKLDLIE